MLVADLSIMGPKSQADALTSRGTHAAGSSPNGHGISAFFNIVSRITPDLGLAPLGGGRRPYFPRLSAAVHAQDGATAAKDGICFFAALVMLTEGHPWT